MFNKASNLPLVLDLVADQLEIVLSVRGLKQLNHEHELLVFASDLFFLIFFSHLTFDSCFERRILVLKSAFLLILKIAILDGSL